MCFKNNVTYNWAKKILSVSSLIFHYSNRFIWDNFFPELIFHRTEEYVNKYYNY